MLASLSPSRAFMPLFPLLNHLSRPSFHTAVFDCRLSCGWTQPYRLWTPLHPMACSALRPTPSGEHGRAMQQRGALQQHVQPALPCIGGFLCSRTAGASCGWLGVNLSPAFGGYPHYWIYAHLPCPAATLAGGAMCLTRASAM